MNSAAAGCGVGVLLSGLITRRRRRVGAPAMFRSCSSSLDLCSSSDTRRDVGASGSDPAGRALLPAGAPLPYLYCHRQSRRGPLEVVGELGGDAAVVAEHAIRLLDLLELLGGGVLMRDVRVVAEAQAAEGAFQDFAVGGFL